MMLVVLPRRFEGGEYLFLMTSYFIEMFHTSEFDTKLLMYNTALCEFTTVTSHTSICESFAVSGKMAIKML